MLSAALQEALRKALERFGIEGPKPGRIADQINRSINAMRRQCTLNADKYVSNETSSSMNWETGKAVGDLSAKAYGVVPAAGGGFQLIIARENAWPADAVSPNGGDIRVLARRGDDDRSIVADSNRFAAGGSGDPPNPPIANPANSRTAQPSNDEDQIPHLTWSFDDRPRVSTSDASVPGSSLGRWS